MFAIGNYFLLIITLMGAICAFSRSDDEIEEQFYINILQEHNKYRKMHGAKNLSLDKSDIKEIADVHLSIWKENLSEILNFISANFFSIEFSQHSQLNAELAKQIVADWYKTGEGYNYYKPPSSNRADPFVRIVWGQVEQIGVATGVKNNKLYVVTQYFPLYDMEVEYRENVISPGYRAPEPFIQVTWDRQLLNHGPDMNENLEKGPD